MEQIKKIDIHVHATAFPQYVAPRLDGTRMVCAEDVLKFYDDLNIEKGLLLPLLAPEAHTFTITNEDCKWISDQYPDRFVWFCSVYPRMGENHPHSDKGHREPCDSPFLTFI